MRDGVVYGGNAWPTILEIGVGERIVDKGIVNVYRRLGRLRMSADLRFNVHDGYSGAESGIVESQAGLDCHVNWKRDLQDPSGQVVRLRIHIKRQEQSSEPRLYVVYLRRRA